MISTELDYTPFLSNEELEQVSGQVEKSYVEASLEILRADARARKLSTELTHIRRRLSTRKTLPAIPSAVAHVSRTIPAPRGYHHSYSGILEQMFNNSLDAEDRDCLDAEEETHTELTLKDIEHLL